MKTINRVPVGEKDLAKRTLEKKVLEMMDNMWKYTNQYRLTKPGAMDEEPTFYINDEVGTSISHSDTPNVRLVPFIYSPNCDMDDNQTTTFSLLWPTQDIKKDECLSRDYLHGITEAQWRSSRLYPWFNVFEEYY